MTREEMREKLRESFDVTADRMEKRQAKIAACREEIAGYDTIFLYGAGTDGIMVAEFLRDALRGKEVCFIDKDKAKHGKEIAPGIVCRGLETMYGYGERAIAVLTTFAYSDGIFYELTRPEMQTPDRLEGMRITDELTRLLFYDAGDRRRMVSRESEMRLFDWMDDDYSCEIMYKGSQWSIPFIDYSPDKVLPPMEAFLPPEIERRLSEDEVFLFGGAFLGEGIREMDKAVNGRYKAWYAFELNRIYCEQMKEELRGKNIVFINAGLGAKDERVDMRRRGNGITPYRYLDVCSDAYANIRSVDAMVADGTITEKITFVKLAMEGAEMPALHGMKKMLKRDKPLLAVSVFGHYKTPQESMHSLAEFLKGVVPEYRLMQRNHSYQGAGGCVLYAFAKD